MTKRIILIITALCIATGLKAQSDSLKTDMINDYSMIGVQYGVSLNTANFNPVRNAEMIFKPVNVGVMYTRYCKMFGFLPYFGFQVGAFYTQEGYRFKESRNGGSTYRDNILGAAQTEYETIEIPAMAHMHFDFWKMKIMANVGVYGGYRMNMKRSEYINDYYYDRFKDYQFKFHSNEHQLIYGLKAGAGLGLAFDPIEVHICGWFKYDFTELHQPSVNAQTMEPDEYSPYYYKWTNPMSIVIAVGIHYQLTRRTGLTRKVLKQQAYEQALEIYEEARKVLDEKKSNDNYESYPSDDIDGQGR